MAAVVTRAGRARADGVIRPDLISWRLGAIRMAPRYREVVDLIRLSDVPCVNPASCLARCFDRLSSTFPDDTRRALAAVARLNLPA